MKWSKKKIKKGLRKCHLWIGLVISFFIFIMAITGCLYSFSEEIKEYVYSERNFINNNPHTNTIKLDSLIKKAESTFNFKHNFENIFIANDSTRTVMITFSESDEDAFWYPNSTKFEQTVYINPYTSNIIKIENTKWEFFNVVLIIHRRLFMADHLTSHIIVLCIMWGFVILIISGMIIWIPKNVKSFRRNLTLFWKRSNPIKKNFFNTHRTVGIYASLLALVSALTALLWLSPTLSSSSKWIANGGKTIPEKETPPYTKEVKSKTPLQNIFSHTSSQYPDYKFIMIRKHPNPTVPYIVRAYLSKTINYKRVEMYYDKETAQPISQETFNTKNNGEKLEALNYDLHVGSVGGLTTRIITFIACFLIASLPVTGVIIWRNKTKRSF